MTTIKYIFVFLPIIFLCCQQPSQSVSLIQVEVVQEDTIEPQAILQKKESQFIPMDSIWRFIDDSHTTSGRCNRPPFFSAGVGKDLYYGFYCLVDKISPRGQWAEIADISVSYKPNKRWMSHDTTQRICELFVFNKSFRPKFASFHVGDRKSQITEEFIKEIDNIHYYHKDNALYCVELIQDTIRQYMILYSCTVFEWDTLHQYVCKHFKQYDRYY